jgi:hypothetical protein
MFYFIALCKKLKVRFIYRLKLSCRELMDSYLHLLVLCSCVQALDETLYFLSVLAL